MTITYEVAGKSDVGCVRQNNEDNFGYDQRYGVYVVCDGMGGQAAGEVASKLAVDTVLAYFREAAKNKTYPALGTPFEGLSARANALASAVHLANQAMHEAGSNQLARQGMGSTIVAVLTEGNFYSIAHVGDSRIYLMRHHQIEQLTQDHSLVMEQFRRGMITREQAENSDIQNIIVRALGSGETVTPDVDDMVAQPGDILLLASDGLTKHVKDDRLADIIEQSPNLTHACNELIQAAKDNGGDDNITCLVIRAVSRSWYFSFIPGGRPKWQNSF